MAYQIHLITTAQRWTTSPFWQDLVEPTMDPRTLLSQVGDEQFARCAEPSSITPQR
jgi:hypothetical protein